VYGTEKFLGVLYCSALLMKRFQIVAGKVPPATAIPCTLSIEISALGWPTHTVASSCGV
jgi:hypothetical protein